MGEAYHDDALPVIGTACVYYSCNFFELSMLSTRWGVPGLLATSVTPLTRSMRWRARPLGQTGPISAQAAMRRSGGSFLWALRKRNASKIGTVLTGTKIFV